MTDCTAGRVGALDHVRVLDLSRVLAGPWATQTLGDMGADIIKVERPECGDDTRAWGPPFVTDTQGRLTGESAYYMCTNRNKRSITIDFTKPEGQLLVRQLAAQCDVLVENFKVGGLAQFGLDYTTLSRENPRLVYCSITGFGQRGPYAQRAGYDFLIQGMGGLMSITGKPDAEPGGGPVKVGVAMTDIMTGLYASTAILGALHARSHTGRGQHIDMALLDVQVACLANQAMNYLYGNVVPGRMGNAHPNTVPYQDFPTSDGHMILAIGNDGQFSRFCRAVDEPSWVSDARFSSNAARLANRDELIRLIHQKTVQRSTKAWVALLEQHAVPCGPINTIADVFHDQHVRARGLQRQMEHPLAGSVPVVASPIRLSDTPVSYRLSPPQLGQHTDEILRRYLNLDSAAINVLRKQGVLG
jgi:crotonobetainyl-CoA:carnitine CoA-transferase CaiB-like acyl-CoA transferase